MAVKSFDAFDAGQCEAVREFLATLPPRILTSADALMSGKAVQELRWQRSGNVLTAVVLDGSLHVPIIHFCRNQVTEATCSCAVRYDCKHAVAALLAGLHGWPAPELTDMAPGNAVRTAAGANAAASPTADEVSLPLAEALSRRLGRPLGERERKSAAMINEIFREMSNIIPESRLLEIGDQSIYSYGWGGRSMMLWPAHRPPRSAVEAWFYVGHALREHSRTPASGLFSIIPWKEVDRLITPWKKEEEIKAWQNLLAKFGAGLDAAAPAPEFRLRLSPEGGQIEWKRAGRSGFEPIKISPLRQLVQAAFFNYASDQVTLDEEGRRFLSAACEVHEPQVFLKTGTQPFKRALDRLLRLPGMERFVVTPDGVPVPRDPEPLRWMLEGPIAGPTAVSAGSSGPKNRATASDYALTLRRATGEVVPPPLAVLPGRPTYHVTLECIRRLEVPVLGEAAERGSILIPVPALESAGGLAAMDKLGVTLPEHLARRVVTRTVQVEVRCRVQKYPHLPSPYFQVSALSACGGHGRDELWEGTGWNPVGFEPPAQSASGEAAVETPLVRLDRSAQAYALAWLAEADVKPTSVLGGEPSWLERRLHGPALKNFPEEFLAWLSRRPDGVTVELDAELASMRDGTVVGSVKLDAEESGVDWFDLRVALDVTDVELTQPEIDALLTAQGRWVRLPEKGWRRLAFNLSDDDQRQLADLGLGVSDLATGETHRLHVFQLAGEAATKLLPAERAAEIRRRAAELRTEVTPEVPTALTAELRPYQREGYHFLAYLSANRFGGILADDMGLGKTVQTLTWLAWLRETGQLGDGPALVVCPKSVQDNWRTEAARFLPSLRVRHWSRDTAGDFGEAPAPTPVGDAPPKKSRSKKSGALPDELIVINYTQLRLHEEALRLRKWSAVILDEAQSIKNPSSQTTRAACALQSSHRLALSGTPIENRLLDLWSIMSFAMPGVLGTRAAFSRNFNGKDDPLARRRLGARVRPFVLRRTKMEVAKDLPDRIEEEIVCDLEGPQATLYRAELKRARATLLKAKTAQQLDALRFNILTSLLRLRQICCHPSLIGAGRSGDESAKLSALLDVLEPLMEEGHKVLVFSQFVEMLEIIRSEVDSRRWPHLQLTGQTENRGALVEKFQQTEGACVFLISLKAGGFGLNLTAASYVVLFDPWWNPAVENQAIDRTHRIGQVNKVIAYRLLVRDTIEEKIRQLQKQKSALASDILGEESFAKALTLDDFQFLLGDGD